MFEYLIYRKKSQSNSIITTTRPFIEGAQYEKAERLIKGYYIEYLYRSPLEEFFYEDSDYAVFLLGEVYRNTNSTALKRQRLTPRDCKLLSDEDYRDLRGFFHIIRIDKQSGELILINDIYGLKPLYYGYDDSYFFISNSLSLLKHSLELIINKAALVEKIIFEHNLNDKTIYNNVRCLDEASFLELKQGFITHRYFSWYDYFLSAKDTIRFKSEVYRERFNNIVSETASTCENNLIPLTGGHDGRALLSSVITNKLPFETFSFGRPGSENTSIPEHIARKLGFKHHSIYLEERFEEEYQNNSIQTIYLSDGELIYSQQSTLYAMKEIGTRSIPLFSGLLAGELLGPVHLIKDYISPAYYRYIYKAIPFDVDEAWRPYNDYFNIEINQYVRDELSIEIGKRIDMITWGFRKFYGYQMHLARYHVNNYPMFCDFDLMDLLINSDYNHIYNNSYKSIYRRRNSRRLQLFLINRNSKDLANMYLDRGYTPRQAVNPLFLGYKLAKYYKRKAKIKAGKHIPDFLGEEWTRLIESDPDLLSSAISHANGLVKNIRQVHDLFCNAKSRHEIGLISNILYLTLE
jgi:asparagine synthetase B (glutamine-hydrolysing)